MAGFSAGYAAAHPVYQPVYVAPAPIYVPPPAPRMMSCTSMPIGNMVSTNCF
jgi:hypothetical protein